MRKKIPLGKKRKFKRVSDRKLSLRDLSVLDFLWTWKVATTPMLMEVAFKGMSIWWSYKALRQLQKEKYIQALPRGKNLEQELWALTDLGFEVILMDRDDITHYRYKPHAPSHDYLATCLQLGDLWLSPVEKMYFTEQMLATLAPSNFPRGLKDREGHVPDGITCFKMPLKPQAFVGYEVDLNLKDDERYRSTFEYYQRIDPVMMIWLVRNTWMCERILDVGRKVSAEFNVEDKRLINRRCHFVLLDDFKERIWDARIINGSMRGESIRKLHANLLQSLGKRDASFSQKPLKEIFFPKFKSPQKSTPSNALTKSETD